MNISQVRRSSIPDAERPVTDRNGLFRVIVECPECDGYAYQDSTWDGETLVIVGDSSGPSDKSRLVGSCFCEDRRTAPEKFVDFEWRVSDEKEAESQKRIKTFFVVLAGCGLSFQLIAIVIGGVGGLFTMGFAHLIVMAIPLVIVWFARISGHENDRHEILNIGDGFLAYAIASWVPLLLPLLINR